MDTVDYQLLLDLLYETSDAESARFASFGTMVRAARATIFALSFGVTGTDIV
jgi:hypothetical protein